MEVNSPVRLAWGTKQRSSTCPQVLENEGMATPGCSFEAKPDWLQLHKMAGYLFSGFQLAGAVGPSVPCPHA